MQYSVLVAGTGDGPGLQETLAAVHGQMQELDQADEAQPRSGELVAVLTQPREACSAIERASLERWADRIHFDEQANKARALNTAILAARGEWVVFTEQHALPEPGWLAQHLASIEGDDHPWDGAGGPVTPVFAEGGAPRWLRELLAVSESCGVGPWHRLATGAEYTLRDGLGPMPFGMNAIYRREVLRSFPLPEVLGQRPSAGLRSGEDIALAVHLLSQGKRLRYNATAEVQVQVPPRRFARAYADEVSESEGQGRGLAIEPGRVRDEAKRALQQATRQGTRARRWSLWTGWRADRGAKVGQRLQALTRSAMLSTWDAQ